MKERIAVTIICLVLLIIGFYTIFTFVNSGFTFSSAEIRVDNGTVSETLYFKPKTSYRTLYRSFVSPLFITSPGRESVLVKSVECSSGIAYVYTAINTCYTGTLSYIKCIPNTEINEIGCTFGEKYLFYKNKEYTLTTTYTFFTPAVVEIKGIYYRKLVLYSPEKHPLLILGDNFFVNAEGALIQSFYLPSESVIIYIPHNGESFGGEYIGQSKVFSSYFKRFWLLIFFGFFPAISFFVVWLFFGKEKYTIDYPDQMSYFPDTKRRGWEVATFFHPPFGVIDKQFFSATLLDLKSRKIIVIKIKDKQAWIKLPKSDFKDADTVERRLINILKELEKFVLSTSRDAEGFVNIKKLISYSKKKTSDIRALQRYIKERSKKYLDYKAEKTMAYFGPAAFILIRVLYRIKESFYFLFGLVTLFWLYVIILHRTAVLVRFKKDFYKEYRHWQSFRKWLKGSFSMKHSDPEAVILWDRYLVYATALGVSGKIIKKLKQIHAISEADYVVFHSISSSSSSFASVGGAGGLGGSVGGGGAGGGGGGGR